MRETRAEITWDQGGSLQQGFFFVLVMACLGALRMGAPATAEPIHRISIDGQFHDWGAVPSYSDPMGAALHDGIPDVHDTDHDLPGEVPGFVNHPDVDILEYKFTHDQDSLYAYFRATGEIGRTQHESQGRAGRYYVVVTIDVDNDDATGYGLHEGGYYPTSGGYDMNMEVEYYNAAFNTGHYLNHGARNESELAVATQDQLNGIVNVLPGSYDYYTQWVWFDNPGEGDHQLPAPDDDASITFVKDKGPVYQGILAIALSPDGHEAEMKAPFRGFMRDADGEPIVALGKTIDISFSLEASGELAPGDEWASDTADPILNYHLDAVVLGDVNGDGLVNGLDVDPFINLVISGTFQVEADCNFDQAVDGLDVDCFVDIVIGGGAAAAVPEPSTLLLAALALAGIVTGGCWTRAYRGA